MGQLIGAAAKFVADFLSNIINGVVSKWLQMRESRKRGEAEAKNEIYEDNAKRKKRADAVMAQPVKKGDILVGSIRNRGNTAP